MSRASLTEIVGTGTNTAFSYTYRDAANYKRHATAVFDGVITEEQLARIRANLHQGRLFDPDDVGLDEFRFGGRYDDDPEWHEADGFTLTYARPHSGDLGEFVDAMATAHWTPLVVATERQRREGLYTTVLVVTPRAEAGALVEGLSGRPEVLFAGSAAGVTEEAVLAGADPTSWADQEVAR